MAYQETVAGWRFIIELSGANWGAAKGEHYISAVNTAIDELEKNTAVPYIFEIVIFVLLFELALIVFLNYPFPVFPFR